ncbi:cilia- and flagella-associated protein 95-like isoform X2 [Watersipora subatra]|uniref:cilia- and flagella-associated protein 95-like isoform X2 n=1 Tax=Watersipora subatra TaxID=2589382 RepID=UPI00355C7A7A
MAYPDFRERPGTLTMRGDHMNYSRVVLNSNWHQARESEPKDYEISTAPVRNLKRATYDRLASITDGGFPKTTYQDHCDQHKLADDWSEKEYRKGMVNTGTFHHLSLDNRDTGKPEKGFGSTLPHHHSDHDRFRGRTTYIHDFQVPYPYVPAEEDDPSVECDNDASRTLANKKCHSQFTDTVDYRRPGRNTWQDESGVYANSMNKLSQTKSTRDLLIPKSS